MQRNTLSCHAAARGVMILRGRAARERYAASAAIERWMEPGVGDDICGDRTIRASTVSCHPA